MSNEIQIGILVTVVLTTIPTIISLREEKLPDFFIVLYSVFLGVLIRIYQQFLLPPLITEKYQELVGFSISILCIFPLFIITPMLLWRRKCFNKTIFHILFFSLAYSLTGLAIYLILRVIQNL